MVNSGIEMTDIAVVITRPFPVRISSPPSSAASTEMVDAGGSAAPNTRTIRIGSATGRNPIRQMITAGHRNIRISESSRIFFSFTCRKKCPTSLWMSDSIISEISTALSLCSPETPPENSVNGTLLTDRYALPAAGRPFWLPGSLR